MNNPTDEENPDYRAFLEQISTIKQQLKKYITISISSLIVILVLSLIALSIAWKSSALQPADIKPLYSECSKLADLAAKIEQKLGASASTAGKVSTSDATEQLVRELGKIQSQIYNIQRSLDSNTSQNPHEFREIGNKIDALNRSINDLNVQVGSKIASPIIVTVPPPPTKDE